MILSCSEYKASLKKLKKFVKKAFFSEEKIISSEKNFSFYITAFKTFFFLNAELLFLKNELENPKLASGFSNFSFKGKNEILKNTEKEVNHFLVDVEIFSQIWDLYSYDSDENFITTSIIENQNIVKKQNSVFLLLLKKENIILRQKNNDFLLVFYNDHLENLLNFLAEREAFYSFYLQLSTFPELQIKIARLILSIDSENFYYFLELFEFKKNYKQLIEINFT